MKMLTSHLLYDLAAALGFTLATLATMQSAFLSSA